MMKNKKLKLRKEVKFVMLCAIAIAGGLIASGIYNAYQAYQIHDRQITQYNTEQYNKILVQHAKQCLEDFTPRT